MRLKVPNSTEISLLLSLKHHGQLKAHFTCLPWSHWGPVKPGSHRQLEGPHSPRQRPLLPQEDSRSMLLQWSSIREQPATVLEDSAGDPRSYSWIQEDTDEEEEDLGGCCCLYNYSSKVIADWEIQFYLGVKYCKLIADCSFIHYILIYQIDYTQGSWSVPLT